MDDDRQLFWQDDLMVMDKAFPNFKLMPIITYPSFGRPQRYCRLPKRGSRELAFRLGAFRVLEGRFLLGQFLVEGIADGLDRRAHV